MRGDIEPFGCQVVDICQADSHIGACRKGDAVCVE